eukprot:s6867_g3.t1
MIAAARAPVPHRCVQDFVRRFEGAAPAHLSCKALDAEMEQLRRAALVTQWHSPFKTTAAPSILHGPCWWRRHNLSREELVEDAVMKSTFSERSTSTDFEELSSTSSLPEEHDEVSSQTVSEALQELSVAYGDVFAVRVQQWLQGKEDRDRHQRHLEDLEQFISQGDVPMAFEDNGMFKESHTLCWRMSAE